MTSILLVYGCSKTHTHTPIKTEPQPCLTFGPLETALTQSEIDDTLGGYKPDENSLITFCYNVFRGIALPESVTAYENYDVTAEETSCQFWREQFSQHIRSAPHAALESIMPYQHVPESDRTTINLTLHYRTICRRVEADLAEYRAGRPINEISQVWDYLREVGEVSINDP